MVFKKIHTFATKHLTRAKSFGYKKHNSDKKHAAKLYCRHCVRAFPWANTPVGNGDGAAGIIRINQRASVALSFAS